MAAADKIYAFKEEVRQEMGKSIFILDETLEKEEKNLTEQYKKNVLDILDKILLFQKENSQASLGSILFVLSRVFIDNGSFSYPVHLYGGRIYMDSYGEISQLEVSHFFLPFLQSKEKLVKDIRKYRGLIEEPELDAELYTYLKYYNMYLVKILRLVFEDTTVSSLTEQINKNDEFYILQSELYEKPYLIYESQGGLV